MSLFALQYATLYLTISLSLLGHGWQEVAAMHSYTCR